MLNPTEITAGTKIQRFFQLHHIDSFYVVRIDWHVYGRIDHRKKAHRHLLTNQAFSMMMFYLDFLFTLAIITINASISKISLQIQTINMTLGFVVDGLSFLFVGWFVFLLFHLFPRFAYLFYSNFPKYSIRPVVPKFPS